MRLVNKQTLLETINFMKAQGIPFTLKRVNKSYEIHSAIGKKRYGDGGFTLKSLNFIKSVKKHVLKNRVYERLEKKSREDMGLKYMTFDKSKIGHIYSGFVEIDLNNAYWVSAKRLGIISDEIYRNGMKFTKIERLASLGSLAKREHTRHFNGHQWENSFVSQDSEQTRHLWYHISNEVDKAMGIAMDNLGDDFAFYWVDAIFIRDTEDNMIMVKDIFLSRGFESKVVKIGDVDFKDDRVIVYHEKKGKGLGDGKYKGLKYRTFNYSVNHEGYWSLEQYKKRVEQYFNTPEF